MAKHGWNICNYSSEGKYRNCITASDEGNECRLEKTLYNTHTLHIKDDVNCCIVTFLNSRTGIDLINPNVYQIN